MYQLMLVGICGLQMLSRWPFGFSTRIHCRILFRQCISIRKQSLLSHNTQHMMTGSHGLSLLQCIKYIFRALLANKIGSSQLSSHELPIYLIAAHIPAWNLLPQIPETACI